MYLVDIFDTVTRRSAGPSWFVTSGDKNKLSLPRALKLAKEWVANSGEPDRYEVMYRIVGGL
jgi:hypothetical protein